MTRAGCWRPWKLAMIELAPNHLGFRLPLESDHLRDSLIALSTTLTRLADEAFVAQCDSSAQEAIRVGAVKQFEICYDLFWRALRRYLVEELALPEVPYAPKPIFRLANENLLLVDSAERWQEYAAMRVRTEYIYGGVRAAAVVADLSTFVGDAIDLYCVMTGETWQ